MNWFIRMFETSKKLYFPKKIVVTRFSHGVPKDKRCYKSWY